MKITVLGSGGGEGYPAMFCGCDHCNVARRVGGKSIRTLSQTLINDDLLIDLPADTSLHALRHGLNLGDVANVLITHTHLDHFVPSLTFLRGSIYAHELKHEGVGIYGSSDVPRVFNAIADCYGVNARIRDSISLHELAEFNTERVGEYDVTALPAKHAIGTLVAYNYIIERDGKCLIYFHDTGYPNDEIIDFLSERGALADCVMMDATMGTADIKDSEGHMCFEQDKRLARRLVERGIADGHTKFVANHITHNNAETHDKVEEIFAGTGIDVSFDGYTFEI